MESKNKMYEDHDVKEEYQHPTLTVSTPQAYSGPVGEEYREPQDSWLTCHCRSRDLLGAFFIILAILLAVASLTLTLLLWFGVYGGSECSCPEVKTDDLMARIAEPDLMARIAELRLEQERLTSQLNMVSMSSVTHQALQSNLSSFSSDIASINSSFYSSAEEERTPSVVALTFPNVSLYESCALVVVGNCTVEKELGDVPANSVVTTNCSTESTPVFVEGTYLLDSFCALYYPDRDFSVVYSQLEDGDANMRCTCTRYSYPQRVRQVDLHCLLYTNRCPSLQEFGMVTISDPR